MAIQDQTTTAPTTSSLGSYDDYAKQIQSAAASTGKVAGGIDPLTGYLSSQAGQAATGPNSGITGAQIEAIGQSAQAKAAATQAQATKAASALQMTGAATLSGVQALDSIVGGLKKTATDTTAFGEAAVEKADEYVKAARGRVDTTLQKIDDINKSIGVDNDFAKAHDMQAAVQATMGSMKDEERNITQNYGTGSKEYQQFQASKKTALASIQSNIQASYAKIKEQQQEAYLGVTADVSTKMNMYVGYQEQQHVQMLQYQDTQKQTYALQSAQLEATMEQMKMSGMENLANWIVQSPTFTMDATPYLTAIADIQSKQKTENAAIEAARPYRTKVRGGPIESPMSWDVVGKEYL